MSLRLDYLKDSLYKAFAESLYEDHDEDDDSLVDAFNFLPMLFLVKEDWDLIGGPLEDNEDPLMLVSLALRTMDYIVEQEGKILPYVLMATTGRAELQSEKDDVTENITTGQGRLFTIHSEEFQFSLVEFEDEQYGSYAFDFIVDPALEVACKEILELIGEMS